MTIQDKIQAANDLGFGYDLDQALTGDKLYKFFLLGDTIIEYQYVLSLTEIHLHKISAEMFLKYLVAKYEKSVPITPVSFGDPVL